MELLEKVRRNLLRLRNIHRDSHKCYLKILWEVGHLRCSRGFHLMEYHDFEFDKKSGEYIDSFLNGKEQIYFLRLLNPRKYYSLARNKYLTHVVLDSLGITKKARLFCYYNPQLRVWNQKCVAFDVKSTLRVIRSQGITSCVIKTTESSHGDNVWVIKDIHYRDDDAVLIRFDNKELLLSNVLDKEPLIFESTISQTKQLSAFNPSSVNTVRFMTTLFPNGEARVIATFIKIGRSGRCVDNAGEGGNVDACIDVETGMICNTIEFNGFRNVIKIEKHPDTGVLIEGTIVENWDNIKKEVIKFQQAFPFVKAAGWDIALTDEGPVIIEVNDMWDRTGQLFIGRGWKSEIEECYNSWKAFK